MRDYYQKLYSKPHRTKEEDKEEIRCLESITNAMKDNESLEMNRKIAVKEIEDSIDRSKRNKKTGPDFITNDQSQALKKRKGGWKVKTTSFEVEV